jgi:SPP1 gp7 family putative phage head morphogenesis protein
MSEPLFARRPSREAIAAFKAKAVGARTPYFSWRDLEPEEHATAFVVAKALRADVLEAIHALVEESIAQGLTRDQFVQRLEPRLRALGWWGRRTMTDPQTGEAMEVQLGSPRRLKIIYDTNLRTAHAAGLWQRIQDDKALLPWLVYRTQRDERVRASHARFDAIVARVDDPFWDTHYPPNGWNCRCFVMQMSDGMLASRGLKPSPPTQIAMARGAPTKVENKRTGVLEEAWPGVDAGWAYNPGQARLAALDAAARRPRAFDADVPARARPRVGLARLLRKGRDGDAASLSLLTGLVRTARLATSLGRGGLERLRLRLSHDGVEALVGGMAVQRSGDDLAIAHVEPLPLALRGVRIGQRLYDLASLQAAARGGRLLSGRQISASARRVWAGYAATGRVQVLAPGVVLIAGEFELAPGSLIEVEGDTWISPDPIFALHPPRDP